MAIESWLIPLAGILLPAFLTWVIVWYFVKRAQFTHQPDQEYRRLAEEAVRGQRAIAEEAKRMADAVAEIQRLMSKV